MTGAVLRAGAWPAVAGLSGAAVVVGGCGAAFPAAASVLLPICFVLLAAATLACGSVQPAPVAGTPLTVSRLKFAVMDAVGKPAYCDRDFYPIAREGGDPVSADAALALRYSTTGLGGYWVPRLRGA